MAYVVYYLKSFFIMRQFLYALSSTCNILSNIQVIPGYRCFVDMHVYLNITPMHRYSCRQNCIMNKRCSYVQHNVVRNYCIVSKGPCLWLQPDTDYNVTIIRRKSMDQCVKWVPKAGLHNPARTQDTCIPWRRAHRVGRISFQSNILLGTGAADSVFTILNGRRVRGTASGWLDVQPGCKVSWVPFTGGDHIPNGAVQGGYLYDSGKLQPIYVMGAVKSGRSCTAYGYYDPSSERGYFDYFGVNECTEMNLMVIDWFSFFL